MKSFADRLREARKTAGMTQEQLGFALGVTKASISAWENGRETPSFRTLPRLGSVLRRSLDELLCGAMPAAMTGEDRSVYTVDDLRVVARDEKERALLLRYRALPARRQAALLDLIG